MAHLFRSDIAAWLNSDEARGHVEMRQAARNYLAQVGIRSNPGFTDGDIIGALRQQAGMEPAEAWEESFDNPRVTEIFQGHLTDVLSVAGVALEEPVTARRIVEAFDQLSEMI